MDKLINSSYHWERRIAMVATLSFIKANSLSVVFKYTQMRMNDPEDLMHKACGWMLREAGKKDSELLKQFLHQYGIHLKRTTLRYSIERFSKKERDFFIGYFYPLIVVPVIVGLFFRMFRLNSKLFT